MKPALAIFRKDVRHLWPRIVLVLAVELVIGWISFSPFPGQAGVWSVLDNLAALAWWYLIAAVIYEEVGPGDRQYWLTRPFSGWHLLSAKLIFILVFACLPRSLAGVASMVLRGISPVAHLPEMLVSQLLFLTKLALPVAALASVTRGLVQFAWVSMAAWMGFFLLTFPLFLRAQSDPSWGGLEWFRTTLMVALLLSTSAAALLVQYLRRRTWLSRGILAATLLLGVLLTWIPGWHAAFALQARLSGQSVAATVARITFDPGRDPRTRPSFTAAWPGQIVNGIAIPVRVTGILDGMAVYSDRASATLEAPDGERSSSGWDSLNTLFRWLGTASTAMEEERLLLGDGEYWLQLNIDRSFYRRFRSGRMHLHARLALTLLSPEQITALARRAGAQAIPDDGLCWMTSRERSLDAACSWPVRTPGRISFRQRPVGADRPWLWGLGAVSYGPPPIYGGFWPWAGQTARWTDAPPAGLDLVTRKATAHFERELDVPDLRQWANP